MRVTQSMLSSNMLRNLSNSYSKMGKLQEQITSGSRVNRPSDDPVAAIKGMGYRTTLGKVEQYTRNIGEVNSWLDNTDESFDGVGNALKRVQELVTSAANDATITDDDREKMKAEIDQIRLQLRDLGNTKVGDKYIFSGTNTSKPLFTNSVPPVIGDIANIGTYPGLEKNVNIEISDGVQLTVNTTKGSKIFGDIDAMMDELSNALEGFDVNGAPTVITGTDIGNFLSKISTNQAAVLEERADVGAKQNRIDMVENRLGVQEVMVTKQLSENESVEYEKAITEMITQQSIHQAALSVGAKIIQATLVDFIR
ncbi:flagellar hook-associated protein FlgL [Psychrobacillus sp. L3]|uniref:flagellar hook-associated protein FlgL n=1 Tax=Psychrobacillus sp. L3 TaxID=3236891 RepID=UPI0036F43EB6